MREYNSLKIYFFIFYLFILSYFSLILILVLKSLLNFGGADGFSYMSISKDAPNITSEKLMIFTQKDSFFPYIIGIFSKTFRNRSF